jgi:nucleoside-diphosphate-sugar epimerase
MNSMARHVIFGTGAIGLATLDALLRRDETVRMVNRSGTARVPVGGNAADPQFTIDVTRGAQVIYQTLNPPYERWVEEFPALQAGVLAAAEAHGARLVSMENVYMYGRLAGRPLTETRDYAAHTKKGTLRGRMAQELLDAHRTGRVAVAIGRASDYFGPGGGAQSNLGDRVFPAAIAGKTATVLGDPDQPHTYTYIPDIGEGLAVLGEHRDAPGQAWHLPNDPDTRTTRQLVELVYRHAGQPRVRLRRLPHSSCGPSACSTPPCASSSRCSTSSRSRSSSTPARSRTSSAFEQLPSTKPSATPSPAIARHQSSTPPDPGTPHPGNQHRKEP